VGLLLPANLPIRDSNTKCDSNWGIVSIGSRDLGIRGHRAAAHGHPWDGDGRASADSGRL
jgi:hypothetical protein